MSHSFGENFAHFRHGADLRHGVVDGVIPQMLGWINLVDLDARLMIDQIADNRGRINRCGNAYGVVRSDSALQDVPSDGAVHRDRKSTRLNSSHVSESRM